MLSGSAWFNMLVEQDGKNMYSALLLLLWLIREPGGYFPSRCNRVEFVPPNPVLLGGVSLSVFVIFAGFFRERGICSPQPQAEESDFIGVPDIHSLAKCTEEDFFQTGVIILQVTSNGPKKAATWQQKRTRRDMLKFRAHKIICTKE